MRELTVTWDPAWYELDQSVKCGVEDEFWVLRDSKNNIRFYNALNNKENVEVITGEVIRISHKSLGDVLEINTDGLSYKIVLASGEYIIVEAEEAPGEIESSSSFKEDFDDDGFKFIVTIRKR